MEFERSTGFEPFSGFNEDQAIKFKERLRTAKTQRDKRPVSAASVRTKILDVQKFFRWYIENLPRGVKIQKDHIDFLSPSRQELALSKTSTNQKTIPTLKQCERLMQVMPSASGKDKRSRALIAMLCLTACRVTALSQIPIGAVDLERKVLFQNAQIIKTKADKSIATPFMPVGEVFENELESWITYLQDEMLFGPNDPLFPKLEVKATAQNGFTSAGLGRDYIKSPNSLTKLVGDIFEDHRLPRTSPHRFRDMIVSWAANARLETEQFRVVSMALGHEDLSTTLTSYGKPTAEQSIRVMADLRKSFKN